MADCTCEPGALVAADVETALAGAFPRGERSGFRPQPTFGDEPIDSSRFTMIGWEYEGLHDRSFAGVAATGRPIHIKGVTVVEHLGDDRHLFHRYIDWVAVMAQLGLSASFRPAVDRLPDSDPASAEKRG